jgi:hypothetical protein
VWTGIWVRCMTSRIKNSRAKGKRIHIVGRADVIGAGGRASGAN